MRKTPALFRHPEEMNLDGKSLEEARKRRLDQARTRRLNSGKQVSNPKNDSMLAERRKLGKRIKDLVKEDIEAAKNNPQFAPRLAGRSYSVTAAMKIAEAAYKKQLDAVKENNIKAEEDVRKRQQGD